MAQHANHHLRKTGAIPRLSRGYAQSIPFTNGVFNSVVATFPAEYIFDPQTLVEMKRVLVPAGKLVILPMAWITGTRPLELVAAWFFRVSGEAPGMPGSVSAAVEDRFSHAGFEVHSEIVNLKSSQVLVLVANKKPCS
jgi:ubiquinone/menaquinone biosynthesis C-methylase UbiE